ncbi:hypothetical protein H8959_021899 [Pygathrix nigripes]
MDAVVALKDSISANRDTLRKFQAWGHAKAELAEQRVQAEKKAILAQGGDAFRHLVHQRRRQELEAQKRAFEEEQKLRKQEIVSRILKEEAEEDKRKKQRPPTNATHRPTLRDKTWNYISDFCEEKTTAPTNTYTLDYEAAAGPGPSRLVDVISSELIQGDPGASSEEETLAEPEISGLWNEDYKPYQTPADGSRPSVAGSPPPTPALPTLAAQRLLLAVPAISCHPLLLVDTPASLSTLMPFPLRGAWRAPHLFDDPKLPRQTASSPWCKVNKKSCSDLQGNSSATRGLADQLPAGAPRTQRQMETGSPPRGRDDSNTPVAEPERLTTAIPPSEEQTEITLGEITEGEIGPFSSIKVPVIFTPGRPRKRSSQVQGHV